MNQKIYSEAELIKLHKFSNLMLLAGFLSTLFYSASYPYIYAETIKAVNEKYLSAEQIISCVGIIVFSALWNKYGDTFFKHYVGILIAEFIADGILFADVLIRGNLKFYFIFNIIIYSIITKNLSCGGIKLRAKVNPTEKLRERYDNTSNICYASATLIGASIAIFVLLPIKLLFILALIGGVIDNIFYLYIYQKVKNF
jgi:hypothetical protein